MLEYINKVEIKGVVGGNRVSEVGGTQVANFSVVTNYLYKTRDGAEAETYWFNVTAWAGRHMPADFNAITRGSVVLVQGRLRNRSFQGSDGSERTINELVASRVEICQEKERDDFFTQG